MKQFLILIFFVFLMGNLCAQDARAEHILKEVSEKAKAYASISADFIFSMKNIEMEMDEKNTGHIKIKGQKYCVEIDDLGMKVFSDGTTLWNYMEEGNQVTINTIDNESSELMSPSSLFNIYEKGFDSKFIAEKTISGKTVYQIEMYPNSEEYDVDKILVTVDKSSMFMHSAELYADGNIYGILVEKLITTEKFTDENFVFNPDNYPDIEVIDFR